MSGRGRMEDLVVVVTGAAGGMGATHCRRLAAEGARVLALDLDTPATTAGLAALTDALSDAGGRAAWRTADIRDVSALRTAVDEGLADLAGDRDAAPRVDAVVVNAGVYDAPGPVWEVDDEASGATLRVDVGWHRPLGL